MILNTGTTHWQAGSSRAVTGTASLSGNLTGRPGLSLSATGSASARASALRLLIMPQAQAASAGKVAVASLSADSTKRDPDWKHDSCHTVHRDPNGAP